MSIDAIGRTAPRRSEDSRWGGRLKLAVQRQGRLTDHTLALLRNAGLEFESYGQSLFSACRNFPLDILYGRDDDIPAYVEGGIVDLGIVGRNLLHEEEAQVEELLPLGYGYCSLVLAVPKESPARSAEGLQGKRVATSYPRSAKRFFDEVGVHVEIVTLSGSVEIAPAMQIADAVVELSATGSTLLVHDLVPIHTILESEAVVAAHPDSLRDPAREPQIERVMTRLRASISARQHKYIMMNAPRSALPRIQEITPGLKSPTVVPLADPDWVAVHTAIREEEFWDVIERLREAGASEILVTAIDKLVM
jgi:ATP phosphoribosyltransferase